MVTESRKDLYREYLFRLEVDGGVPAELHEPSGLDEGEIDDDALKKISGLNKTGDVKRKRGVFGDLSLVQWPMINGHSKRKGGSTILRFEKRRLRPPKRMQMNPVEAMLAGQKGFV